MEKLFNAQVLQLGRQGENGARIIRADVSQWLETYPNGEILLFATRPNELVPYIPADYQVADGILTWTISNVDTGTSGNGRAELRLMDGETIVKSEVVNTEVVPCLPGTGSPVTPTPEVTDWVTRFIDSAETVDEALANADAAVAELDAAIAHAGDIVEVMQDKAPAILSTAGPADVATFTDGAAGMPMEVTVTLDPIQAGSGDPAPDNVRPISGYSAATVYRSGKNFIPQDYPEFVPGYSTANNGITYTINNDGSITCNGTATAASNLNITKSASTQHIPLPEGDYILSGCPAGGGASSYALRLRTQNIGGGSTSFIRDSGDGVAFSVTDEREAARVYIEIASGTVCNNVTFYPMIRLSSVSADYEPWGELGGSSNRTITFPDPPGTVYGGTLTVNRDGTGKLVVDRQVIDLGSLSPTYNANRNWYYSGALSTLARIPATDDENPNIVAEQYISYAYNELAENADLIGISYNTANKLVIRTGSQEVLPAGNIVYYLATPVTYDLTAEQVGQITSVYGLNNVWSAGQVTVTYAADTKAYVDETLGATETIYNADGYEWVQISGVPNYGYACEIPLAGIPRQNVAVLATVTAATTTDFSSLINMLAPFYKVDVVAKKVTFYAAVPMYKIARVRAVYI